MTKCRYGVRNMYTLWNRLRLDPNLAALAVSFIVTQIHEIANQIRTVCLNYDTWKRKSPKLFVENNSVQATPWLCRPLLLPASPATPGYLFTHSGCQTP